jgi:hypothetical protein
MKVFTDKCCELLLSYTRDNELKKNYSATVFSEKYFEFLKQENPIAIPDDFKLEPKSESDLENSIKIFEIFNSLDLVQANDRRLWVTLTHTIFFDYCRKRWFNDVLTDKQILRRFHFEGISLEARMRNSISRLWWGAKITYDSSKKDPYELTRLLWTKQDIYQGLVERSYGTYEPVVKGFLEFYSENQDLKESQIRKLFTALNSIGGVKVLSAHSTDEIKTILSQLISYFNFKLAA